MIKKNKEKLQTEARERYQNLSEEEKEKRRKKAQDRYKNLSEKEKEKKRQYHRDCMELSLNGDIITPPFPTTQRISL